MCTTLSKALISYSSSVKGGNSRGKIPNLCSDIFTADNYYFPFASHCLRACWADFFLCTVVAPPFPTAEDVEAGGIAAAAAVVVAAAADVGTGVDSPTLTVKVPSSLAWAAGDVEEFQVVGLENSCWIWARLVSWGEECLGVARLSHLVFRKRLGVDRGGEGRGGV